MATILPETLDETSEIVNVNVTFTAQLDIDETLVDINITAHRANSGITVSGSSFSGAYIDSFDLGTGALKYRDTRDDSYHVVDSFDQLPSNPQHGHVYEFNAPSPLTTDYDYTVTLNYIFTDPVTMLPTPMQLVRTIDHTVVGNYSAWGQQLRDYIAGGE
ncbi:hypothetical protein NVP1081O_337 [Vibrio phage 1.081.O._10N.286.52.C2]|nr:hypothetical protein NVP1081O_337 [Vibrio phage 1.081.O._10N.286.52.C2]